MSLLPHAEMVRQIVRRPAWKRYYAGICKCFAADGNTPPSQMAVINEIIGCADDLEVAQLEKQESTVQ